MIDIHFTIHGKNYRIRRIDKYNLVLERQQASKRWINEGYHSPYSLRFAILAIVTKDIKGELMELFREQNRLLEKIEKRINEAMRDTGQ